MAVIYLRSGDGSDASDGLTWANAKATLAAALTAAGAGGTVYVADGHAESQASAITLTSPGTAASPVTVLCVDDTGDPEPPTTLATTAAVTTSAGGIAFNGFAYCYGLTFTNSSNTPISFTSASPWWWRFDNCTLRQSGAAATNADFKVGSDGGAADDQLLELINSNINYANAGQSIDAQCRFLWRGGAAQTTAVTELFKTVDGPGGIVLVEGVDLSVLGGSSALVNVGAGSYGTYRFENCKLGASVTVVTGTNPGQGGAVVTVVNCDSADTNYRYHKSCYQGDITQETTIVRTGGATDGTTPVSRKMLTTANSKFYSPLESDPVVFWNETTGSGVTVTVEVVTDNVTLTDAEAWVEVEYLGTSGFPLSLFASDKVADALATPANQESSTAAWTTTGLTTPVKQKLSVTFTPQEKGPVRARVMLARPEATMYFDPKVAAG